MTTTSKCMSFTTDNTGGEYNHQLSYDEMPGHAHNEYVMVEGYPDWDSFTPDPYSMLFNWQKGEYREKATAYHAARVFVNTYTSTEGRSQTHNNMQPYIVTYFWRRTK